MTRPGDKVEITITLTLRDDVLPDQERAHALALKLARAADRGYRPMPHDIAATVRITSAQPQPPHERLH